MSDSQYVFTAGAGLSADWPSCALVVANGAETASGQVDAKTDAEKRQEKKHQMVQGQTRPEFGRHLLRNVRYRHQ